MIPYKDKVIFCIMGKTCAGKDSLVKKLCSKDKRYSTVVSYTDRPIRDNETNGVEHYFVSKAEFTKIKEEGEVIAYTEFIDLEGNVIRYMALKDELDKHNIYIIDPPGYEDLKNTLKQYADDSKLVSILIDAPYEDRENRASNTRSDYESSFKKRCESEDAKFEGFKPDFVIYNGNNCFNNAYKTLKAIMKELTMSEYLI